MGVLLSLPAAWAQTGEWASLSSEEALVETFLRHQQTAEGALLEEGVLRSHLTAVEGRQGVGDADRIRGSPS